MAACSRSCTLVIRLKSGIQLREDYPSESDVYDARTSLEKKLDRSAATSVVKTKSGKHSIPVRDIASVGVLISVSAPLAP